MICAGWIRFRASLMVMRRTSWIDQRINDGVANNNSSLAAAIGDPALVAIARMADAETIATEKSIRMLLGSLGDKNAKDGDRRERGCSWMTYRLIERPSRRIINAIGHRERETVIRAA